MQTVTAYYYLKVIVYDSQDCISSLKKDPFMVLEYVLTAEISQP